MSERNLIILAEDTDSQRAHFVQAFQAMGLEVRAFDDGAPAMKAIEKLTPEERQRAIVVSDFVMLTNGATLANFIRTEYPDLPLLVWTIGGTKDYVVRTLKRAGAHHVLNKTTDTAAIRAALDTTLQNFTAAQQAVPPTGGKGPLDHARKEPGQGLTP